MSTDLSALQSIDEVIAERRRRGIDRHDEVWDGEYIIMPAPNNQHQHLVGQLCRCLSEAIDDANLGHVYPGVNVSDRADDWTQNFRCPDVAVFLASTEAVDQGTFWHGGPDFAVEIASPDNRTYEKLEFYEQVGTRELLIIDRDPWKLTLYRLENGKLQAAGESTADNNTTLASQVIPLSFRLIEAGERTPIEIRHATDGRRWAI